MSKLTFEDFRLGYIGSFGPRRVSRNEIVAFAAEYDPQPMHLDEQAAGKSMLNGLAASGWHLCAIMRRMVFDELVARTASRWALGVNELRWISPLRPEDDVTVEVEVIDKWLSRTDDSTGIVLFRCTARRAGGDVLCELTTPVVIARNPIEALRVS